MTKKFLLNYRKKIEHIRGFVGKGKEGAEAALCITDGL